MNLKFLTVLSLILFLSGSISAFTPAPCVTTTGCDCELEFCTRPQLTNYIIEEKIKDLEDKMEVVEI